MLIHFFLTCLNGASGSVPQRGRRTSRGNYLTFVEDCDSYPVSDCCHTKIGQPLPQWVVTIGDAKRTRANNLLIRLLVGCDGLESDAARFRSRSRGAVSDPSCEMCGAPVDDARHFISCCPALEDKRRTLFAGLPCSLRSQLPDHHVNPSDFADVILGVDWIDDRNIQCFFSLI